MNTKTETSAPAPGPAADYAKWAGAALLIGGGIFGYHHFDQYPLLYRVLALLPIVAIALLIAMRTQGGGALWELVKQARMEVYKVVWPTRQETTQTTMVVLLVVLVIALILWLLDMLFGWLASLIIG